MRKSLLISIIAAIMLWAASTASLAQERRYASIVVDADTLEIIHARQIDELRYPASLTKMITLYLVFDALNAGHIHLLEPLKVSRAAARAKPTKLGLKAGQSVPLETLIKAVAVKSANDAAVVIAERLGGSEERFADIMTAKARSMGMTKTTFKTANGLPHPEQKTSARDMAKLAHNLLNTHRRYYHYFGLTHFSYQGRRYKNTNALLHSLGGVDGFKTGFTNDSGYNLVISAQREGRRLIAVVLGGASGASRNSHMQDLVERGFGVMGLAPQRPRPQVTVARAPVPNRAQPHLAATQAVRLRGRDSRPVAIVAGNEDIQLSARENVWAIQVGAFKTQQGAQDQITAIDGVTGLKKGTVRPLSRNGQTLYRARFEDLTVTQAQKACKALAQLASGCLIVASN